MKYHQQFARVPNYGGECHRNEGVGCTTHVAAIDFLDAHGSTCAIHNLKANVLEKGTPWPSRRV